MDASNPRKREGQQLLCSDVSAKPSKRIKSKNVDFICMFLKVISELSEEKKNIIRKLGFGNVLSLACSSNINDIYIWLATRLDTNSGTVTFENGFSFTISPEFAHTMLGIPLGPKDVQTKPSKEATDFILNIIQTESPTVEYLCSFLSKELDEATFSRAFITLMLTAFIAPNGRGTASSCYYPNLIDLNEIHILDWCSFTVSWLLLYIKKYLFRKLQDINSEIGGCKLLLVASYFEFLITSEFNLGASIPRLQLWTTSVVNSYIALDSLHGPKREYGRLARKHISSTPFKSCPKQIEMPAEIQQHIDLKFHGNPFSEEKMKLQLLSFNFFEKVLSNSIPIVKSYIDDLIQLIPSSQDHVMSLPSKNNVEGTGSAIKEKETTHVNIAQPRKEVTEHSVNIAQPCKEVNSNVENNAGIDIPSNKHSDESGSELKEKMNEDVVSIDGSFNQNKENLGCHSDIAAHGTNKLGDSGSGSGSGSDSGLEDEEPPPMFIFPDIPTPKDNYKFETDIILKELSHQFLEGCKVNDSSPYTIDLPCIDYDFQVNLLTRKLDNEELTRLSLPSPVCELIDLVREGRELPVMNQNNVQDYKFSFETMSYYQPSHQTGGFDDTNCQLSSLLPNEETDKEVMLSHSHQTCTSLKQSSELTSHHAGETSGPSDGSAQKCGSFPSRNFQYAQPTSCQSSHISSKQTAPNPIMQPQSQQSNRGLSLNEHLRGKRMNPPATNWNQQCFPSFELLIEEIPNDNSLESEKKGEGGDLLITSTSEPMQQVTNERLTTVTNSFVPSSAALNAMQQVIFPNDFEHEFYNMLTNCKPDYSPRIFEIRKVWVDQRTLKFSMSPGGWIHPHVMDCFGILLTTQQQHRRKKGFVTAGDILKHVVIKDATKILMNPKLNYDDPKYRTLFGLNNVGFRLENAGLVHIPCPNDKEWILIVANFIDQSFDVLNPDYSIEKFSSIVRTVTHNFKQLFLTNYPGCRKFNIRDFNVRYVHVPKYNFRYDSGIFVMQFIHWYNGLVVKHFSNLDVQAIREKISCQLVINIFNEVQVPLAKQFLSKHAPELLH